ncbi:tetratricopeptide repeat protein, partial [Myxococcota bacterium]|nr:tetratricopeptide repeat protein [Myxococcota bacterium]
RVEPAPLPAMPAARRPQLAPAGPSPLKLALIGISVTLALVLGAAQWRLWSASRRLERVHQEALATLRDGNFQGRLDVAARLEAETVPQDPFTRLGRLSARLLGLRPLEAAQQARLALRARVAAERLTLFGEGDMALATRQAIQQAQAVGADGLDLTTALALEALARGQLAEAQAAFDRAGPQAKADPEGALLHARLLAAAGDSEQALSVAEGAALVEGASILVRAFAVDLRAARLDPEALRGYAAILQEVEHISSEIARQRLKIALDDDPLSAVGYLKDRLRGEARLAPAQQAAIHDALGLYHTKRGELEAARAAFEAARAAAPDDPRFATGLARLALRQFKLDEAEALFKHALLVAPGRSEYHVELARAQLYRGDPAEALAQLKAVQRPHLDALLIKGQAQLMQDDPRGAAESLAEAAKLKPKEPQVRLLRIYAAYLSGQRAEQNMELLALLKDRTIDEDRALPWLVYGGALLHARQPTTAAKALQQGLSLQRDFRLYDLLCQAEAQRFRAREALDACYAALKLNPYYLPSADMAASIAEAHEDIGAIIKALAPLSKGRLSGSALRRLSRAYVQQNRLEQAQALLQVAQTEGDRRYVEGLLAVKLHDVVRARDHLTAAAAALSSDPWVQMAVADFLMQIGDPAKAGAYYAQAMQLTGGPWPALGAARAALLQDDWRQALKLANKAVRLSQRSLSHPKQRAQAIALKGLAMLKSGKRGNIRRAKSFFDLAVKIERDLPYALLGRGLYAASRGADDEAVQLLHRAASVAPADPEIGFHYARFLFSRQDTRAQGAQELKRVYDMDPGGMWGRQAAALTQGAQ